MKFEQVDFQSLQVDLYHADEIMHRFGLIRAGQWDYERVTYDRKFEIHHHTFYLRVQGYAIEGDIGGKHAVIQFMTPLLGKHYYPHGVEYGEDEDFPSTLVDQCTKILEQVKTELEAVRL
ncbi:hypothetical protein FZC66_12315 [Priestia megaterium]|nr:hypothetical protein FZC66_12315 [Priestia megaterium]